MMHAQELKAAAYQGPGTEFEGLGLVTRMQALCKTPKRMLGNYFAAQFHEI
jgi:hypothetical protein